MNILESYKDSKMVGFCNLCWKNRKDVILFVKLNNKALNFGYFTDHLSICNLVYNQKTGDGDFIKKFGSLKKTNLGCVRNHQAIANFSTGIPRLYSSGKQTRVCMDKSAFSRYPKHSDFADSV